MNNLTKIVLGVAVIGGLVGAAIYVNRDSTVVKKGKELVYNTIYTNATSTTSAVTVVQTADVNTTELTNTNNKKSYSYTATKYDPLTGETRVFTPEHPRGYIIKTNQFSGDK